MEEREGRSSRKEGKGRKTLDKSVLVARAQESQEVLPGNAVHENFDGAASIYIQVTGSGGLEGAPLDLSHFTELDGTSEHKDGAKTHEPALEQEPAALTKPNGKDIMVIEAQREGSDKSSLLTPPAGGSDGGADGEARGEKNRRRSWTDEETELLLKAAPRKLESRSRIGKSSGSEASWEAIAEGLPGRTGDQCRMRMDTLIKSYCAIKAYFRQQNKDVRQLNEADFGIIKPATRFKLSWFNDIRDYWAPGKCKKMENLGGGSPLENEVELVSSPSTSGELAAPGLKFLNPDVSDESLESRGRSSSRRDRKRRKKKYESDVSDSSEDGRVRSSSRKDRKRDKDRKERKRLRKEKRKDKERRRNKEEPEELSSGAEVDAADMKPEDVVAEIYSNLPNEAKDLGQQDYLRKISLKMLSLETKANGNPLQARATPKAHAATTASQPQQVQQQLMHQLQQQWQLEQHHSFVKIENAWIRAMKKLPYLNNEQCNYLVDKLYVVIESASSFLAASSAEDHPPYSSVDLARHAENFKLLLALANQVESFVQDCCKDAWIQAAMTLTNVAEYVSFTAFNLELCKVAFCKERVGSETLTLDQVVNITDHEVEIVKEKASADLQTLLAKLKSLRSLRGEKRESVNYILERLSRSRSSSSAGKDEESFWRRLSEYVKPGKLLGRSSAATVHKAEWLGIQVAMKTFEGHRNMDFMKEVGILGKLCHPNIVSMFCCAKDNRCCSIIMELMDEDLHDLMRRRCNGNINSPGPFPILEAIDIMHQIGEGVNYLHTQKIVHKDLKSINILVKTVKVSGSEVQYVHAKVADFGLSKTKESSITYSPQTFNTGTTRWMAPEIIKLNVGGQVNTLGPKYPLKIDVYSFSMVCYEILSGYEPFHEDPFERIVKEKVVNGERPSLPHHCPPLLKALIEQCWIQEPKERPSFAMICSELKYLKYLLMTGADGMSPTSVLAGDVGFMASSCIGPTMKRTLERRRNKEESEELSSGSEVDAADVKPEDVVAEIYSNFPNEAKDLGQVLKMIDSGQAVDISGLPNKGLVVLLKKLFCALELCVSAGTHLLPQGAEPTMKRLGSVFNKLGSTASARPEVTRTDSSATLDAEPSLVEVKRRVIGPAMPSAETLAAAARLTEAEARLREAELELENDPLIGPAPATVVAEAASANDAERFEEVTRMLSLDVKNAYDLLGVKSDVEPSILKKKYWRLSLMVHPDKCDHPQAQEAFMALNKAFKDLQDPTKKAEIDRKVAEEAAREEFTAALQAKREAAQWRRLRGEEEEGDDELLRGPQEVARDEWMTKLPPERQAGGPPAQHNTFFSKSEKSGRGDTSIWTDTPAAKAEKAKMQYLEAYKQAALTNGPADEFEEREKERAAKEAQLMDSYNSHMRSQSLMEKHKAERAAGGKKKSKKAEKSVGVGARGASEKEPDWKVNHPWKPWDRENDIAAGRKSVNLDPKNFKEGLSSRFGGFTTDEPRKFL